MPLRRRPLGDIGDAMVGGQHDGIIDPAAVHQAEEIAEIAVERVELKAHFGTAAAIAVADVIGRAEADGDDIAGGSLASPISPISRAASASVMPSNAGVERKARASPAARAKRPAADGELAVADRDVRALETQSAGKSQRQAGRGDKCSNGLVGGG